MWKNYSEKGVAIKSSVGALRDALKTDEQNLGIHFADVEYLDYRVDEIGFEVAYDAETVAELMNEEEVEDFWERDIDEYTIVNPLLPFGYKRKYFGYENEFRAITMPPVPNPFLVDWDIIYCEIDLWDLIDEIVISPLTEEREAKTLMNLLANRYEIQDLIVRTSRIQ